MLNSTSDDLFTGRLSGVGGSGREAALYPMQKKSPIRIASESGSSANADGCLRRYTMRQTRIAIMPTIPTDATTLMRTSAAAKPEVPPKTTMMFVVLANTIVCRSSLVRHNVPVQFRCAFRHLYLLKWSKEAADCNSVAFLLPASFFGFV